MVDGAAQSSDLITAGGGSRFATLIITLGVHSLRNAQLGKSFVAGGVAFVHCQHALVGGDELACDLN
jgi:hypothetical protein